MSFKLSEKGLVQSIATLDEVARSLRPAVVRALNRGAVHGRAAGIAQIRERVRFPAQYLRERMDIREAHAGQEIPLAAILARRRGTQLSRFDPQQVWVPGQTVARKRGGVSVFVKQTRARIRSAFLVPLRQGGVGVALRTGRGRGYEILYSTSVHDAFEDAIPLIRDEVNQFTQRQLRHELRFLLAGGRNAQ